MDNRAAYNDYNIQASLVDTRMPLVYLINVAGFVDISIPTMEKM